MDERDNHTGVKRTLFGKVLNVYGLAILCFLVWVAFFDKNNLVEEIRLQNKISKLKQEKAYYQQKIEEDRRSLEELLGNRDNLEKFARERYLMKRADEDIFVIVDE